MSKKQITILSAILTAALMAVFGLWMIKNRDDVGKVAGIIADEKLGDSAQLNVFSSKVEILIPGESDWKEGLDGDEIIAGTRVRTNQTGRGEIRFPGGSVTRIDHDSEIMIDILDTDESNFVINLSRGKIWSRVSKLLGRVSYETKTGRTIATVRGTEYGHEIYDDFDRIVVAESKVDVKCVGDDPNTLVVDVQLSDWNCDQDGEPTIKKSSIDELVLDEWYRFNLQEENEEGDMPEPIKVLGVTDESAYVPTPKPRIINQIDCAGPDGGMAKATKQECDDLWTYWNANPPPKLPHVDMGGSNTTSASTTLNPTAGSAAPTPTPSPTPVPINVTNVTCLNDGCFKIAVTGSGFGPGLRLVAKDASLPFVATEGAVNVLDANNMEVDYGTAYSLCYSGQQPYNLLVFYVVGSEFIYPAFVPDFCSIIF